MNCNRLLLSLFLCGCIYIAPAFASDDEGRHAPDNLAEQADDDHPSEEGEHEDDEGHIELSNEQIQAAGIGLDEVGPANIRESLPLYGVIVPNAERLQYVAARFPGVIMSINKQVGDTVRQGETLARIESNESLEAYSLTSKFDGVITERNAHIGEQSGDSVLFVVADLSSVWVEVSLFPRDMERVHVRQHVRIKSAHRHLVGEGKVIHITPFSNRANQTQIARVLLENAERRWKPGLFVSAEVILSETPVPLAVSNDALQTLDAQTVVFVKEGERFEPRPVLLGRSDGDVTEVVKGLEAGETYVARNSFILKSELGKSEVEDDD